MPSLHVMHVVEAFGGGTFSALVQICRATRGSISHSIIHSVRSETPEDLATLFPDVRLLPLALRREISPRQDLKSLRALIRIFKAEKPDVIHSHSAKAGILARFAAWWCDIPVVHTPHGYPFLRDDISRTKHLMYWAFEWIAARFGTLTAACGDTEALYAARLGKTTTVHNGIDLTQFPLPAAESGKTTPAPDSPSLLTAGICARIAPERDPELFKALARRTSEQFRWVWIGGGDAAYGLHLEKNIRVTDWLEHPEAVDQLRTLDVYVQTSRWEGLPFSVMEAMALELPVVASNIIGNNELVVHDETGFLANNTEEFVHYLTRLASDQELRIRMGKAGRARIAERYDSSKTLGQYTAVYRTLSRSK